MKNIDELRGERVLVGPYFQKQAVDAKTTRSYILGPTFLSLNMLILVLLL